MSPSRDRTLDRSDIIYPVKPTDRIDPAANLLRRKCSARSKTLRRKSTPAAGIFCAKRQIGVRRKHDKSKLSLIGGVRFIIMNQTEQIAKLVVP